MIERILPQIDFFVVLMLENRSLDQACGWLYENDKPSQVIGKDLGKPYDGLEKDKYSNSMVVNGQVKTFPVSKVAQGQLKVPPQNPHEDYRHTNNQLYGDAHKTAYETPAFGVPAKCQGFLQDYSGAGDPKPAVLECYTPQNLSVMNGLARHYAVSDRWFCSVPTQTNPNRAFFHCGTSLGRESNENFFAIEQFKAQTIWNVLSDRGVESTTYFHDPLLFIEGKKGPTVSPPNVRLFSRLSRESDKGGQILWVNDSLLPLRWISTGPFRWSRGKIA